SLVVQVASDMVPGREVDAIHVVVTDASGTSTTTDLVLLEGQSLGRPRRVTNDVVPAGRYTVQAALMFAGHVVQMRPLRVDVSGTTYATLLMLRSCNGVTCPGMDDPEATACLAGRCTRPECSEEHPELCPARACASNGDCPASGVACVVPMCSA